MQHVGSVRDAPNSVKKWRPALNTWAPALTLIDHDQLATKYYQWGMWRAMVLDDSVGMNTPASLSTSPLPSFDLEETLPRPARPAPAEPRIRQPRAWSRCTLTLVALGYALTAGALSLVVVAGGLPLRAVEPTALVCALAACLAEWQARRAGMARARDVAPAVYLAAALLLPAPLAVLVALPAIVASVAARRGAPTPVALRFADGAHTVLSVALLAVAAHLALGDRAALTAISGVLAVARHPAALLDLARTGLPTLDLTRIGTPNVWSAAALHAPEAPGVLLLLCAGYYLFETVPSALARALYRCYGPSRAWRELYGYALPLQLVALPLAPVVVALYAATPLLTLAALPLLCGLPWIAVGLRRAPALADQARTLREDTAALYARTTIAAERAARRGAGNAARGDPWVGRQRRSGLGYGDTRQSGRASNLLPRLHSVSLRVARRRLRPLRGAAGRISPR